MTERRHHPPEYEQANADRKTKRWIVGTICGIAVMLSLTVCWVCLRGMNVPDALDRVLTFLLGNIVGMLTKTGVDVAANVGKSVVDASKDEPISTEPVGTSPEGEH